MTGHVPMALRGNLVSLASVVFAALLLAGCGAPGTDVVGQCKQSATREAAGHDVTLADIGELTEACMMKQGFGVRETSRECADDSSGPFDPQCYYYPANAFGRAALWLQDHIAGRS